MIIDKAKVKLFLLAADRDPSLMRGQTKEGLITKIRTSLTERYQKKPCSVEELMKEADQFAPLVWKVYGQVGVERADVVKIAEELVNGK